MAPRIIDRFDEQPISQVLSRKKDFIAALVGLFLAIGGSAYGAPRSSGLWWMPDVATKSGAQIDQLTYFIYYLTGARIYPDPGCLHLLSDSVSSEKRRASHL